MTYTSVYIYIVYLYIYNKVIILYCMILIMMYILYGIIPLTAQLWHASPLVLLQFPPIYHSCCLHGHVWLVHPEFWQQSADHLPLLFCGNQKCHTPFPIHFPKLWFLVCSILGHSYPATVSILYTCPLNCSHYTG